MRHPAWIALLPLAAPGAPAEPGVAADRVALEGATVHTMVPGEEPRVATILIEGGRVVRVASDVEIAPGTERVDLSGKHVVPALIDGCVNFDADHDLLYTTAGVGLVRDLGGDRARLLQERTAERRASALGPHLLTAGALLDGDPPATARAVVLRDPAAVESLLPILLEEQVDFLSTFEGLRLDVLERVAELAHEHDLEVWGPVPRAASLAEALAAGQDGIHFLDRLRPADASWETVELDAFEPAIELLAAGRTPVLPLVHATAARLRNQGSGGDYERLLGLLAPSYEVWWRGELAARQASFSEAWFEAGQHVIAKELALLARLHERGVPLLPGSGAPQPWLFPGQALHQELALWVRAGIPAGEVLRLATRGAAEILGVEAEHGSIQPGAFADFVVTGEDPSEDLGALVGADAIVSRGRVLDRAALEDLLETVHVAQARVREELARPLEVEPPTTPEGVVVLEGLVETRSFGQRLSVERFRVVRLPEDERIAFLGRLVFPSTASEPARELEISQVTEAGRLVEAEVVARQGDEELGFQGLLVGGTWRMRRMLGAQQLDATSTPARPATVDAGSVTSLLVLGQTPLAERVPVVVLHQALAPESVVWRMELDDRGNHQVRTHVGRIAFRFDDVGAPEKALVAVGTSTVETVLVERDAFGGGGLPLPEAKRARIRELRAAEATGPAPEATGPDETGAEDPGGEEDG